jgi:hypothetical protein
MKAFKELIVILIVLLVAISNAEGSASNTTSSAIIASGDATDPWKPCWTHGSWGTIPGAKWVWPTYTASDPEHGETQTLIREFTIDCNPISGYLWIDADNEYAAKLNGVDIKGGPINGTNLMQANKLEITVKNWPVSGSNYQTNPAGLIYKLEVSCDTVTGQASSPAGSETTMPESKTNPNNNVEPGIVEMWGNSTAPTVSDPFSEEALASAREELARTPHLEGYWQMGSRPTADSCQITQNGYSLVFENEKHEKSSGSFLDASTVVADNWGWLKGKISPDGNRIDWANGSWWIKIL